VGDEELHQLLEKWQNNELENLEEKKSSGEKELS
jgi:hypothetical protein